MKKCLLFYKKHTSIQYPKGINQNECEFRKAHKFRDAERIFTEFQPDMIMCEVDFVEEVITLLKLRKARAIITAISFVIDIDPITESAQARIFDIPLDPKIANEARRVSKQLQCKIMEELIKVIPIKKFDVLDGLTNQLLSSAAC